MLAFKLTVLASSLALGAASVGSCYDSTTHVVTCDTDNSTCVTAGNYWYAPGYMSSYSGCCHCDSGCDHSAETMTATFAEARRRRLSTEIVVSYTIATDSATTDSIISSMASLTATDMDAALTTAALAVSETWDGTTESGTAPEEGDDDLDGAAVAAL